MRVRGIAAAFVLAALLCPLSGLAQAQEDVQGQIQEIKTQLQEMDSLKARLADLEQKLAESQKTQQAANEPTVSTAFKGAKLKIDGRIFAGIVSSGDEGSNPNWSTSIPDAKLRFTFLPTKDITIVNRFSTSNAQVGGFDYFYADFAHVLSESNTLRLGQRKIDVGQETWVDNPVENMLISNSVSHVGGYGIGLAAVGRLNGPLSPLYEIGFVNGPKGVTARPSTGLPVNVKVGVPLTDKLFASASYFNTGKLGPADKSAISVAELSSAPGASAWKRNLWEVDLRYNYGPSGNRSLIPTGTLPPFILGATYGRFNDAAEAGSDRSGGYWFGEALLRLSPKMYAAARYSVTQLDNGVLAKLGNSPVAVSSYKRTSIGLGYALTDLAQLKLEYTINNTDGGSSEPGLNQWSTGVAMKF